MSPTKIRRVVDEAAVCNNSLLAVTDPKTSYVGHSSACHHC